MIPILVMVMGEKVTARITIGDAGFTLNTEQLDSLMRRLIEARPLMLPAVEPEQIPPPTPGATFQFRSDVTPNYTFGGAHVCLTHPALGWMTWNFDPRHARRFAFHVLEWTVPGTPPRV